MDLKRTVKKDNMRELHVGMGEKTQDYLWKLHQHYRMPKGEVIIFILNDFLSNKVTQENFLKFYHKSLDSAKSETSGVLVTESTFQPTFMVPSDLIDSIANIHQNYNMRSRNTFVRTLINYYYYLNLGKDFQEINLELFNRLKDLGFNVTDRKVFEGDHWICFSNPPNDNK